MQIAVYSESPDLFTIAFAMLLVKSGKTVNIHSDNRFGYFFLGDDNDKERDGIAYNKEGTYDYEIFINPDTAKPIQFVVTDASYRHLLALQEKHIQGKFTLIKEGLLQSGLGLKGDDINYIDILGKDIQDLSGSYAVPLNDKDTYVTYKLGSQTEVRLCDLSKEYQNVLLLIFNNVTGNNYKKISKIKASEATREVKENDLI